MMDGDTEYTRAQKSTLVAGERAGIKPERRVRQGLVAAGSMLSALAASSCCIVPLVLFSLGASGAWISNFTALAPYQPIFLVLTLSFLAAGFWMVYRRPKATSAEGSSCARPVAAPWFKVALWSTTVLIAAALAFPYIAPLFLGA